MAGLGLISNFSHFTTIVISEFNEAAITIRPCYRSKAYFSFVLYYHNESVLLAVSNIAKIAAHRTFIQPSNAFPKTDG